MRRDRVGRPGRQSGGVRYTVVGSGRRYLLEQIRLTAVLSLTGLTLIALETTVFSRIPLPFPGGITASPALGLLFPMAVGFLYGEEEGGIAGLIAGWLSDATLSEGMMLLPLLYFLCGYLSGTVGKRRLAHNLPSFAVFSLFGGGLKCLLAVGIETVRSGGLPPALWVLKGLAPSWGMTVLFSAAVYGIIKAEQWLLKPKN